MRLNQTLNDMSNRTVVEKIQDELHGLLCDLRVRKRKHVRCKCLKGKQIINCCVFGESWFLKNYTISSPSDLDYFIRKYEDLVNHEVLDEKVYEQIMKDVPRTFSHKVFFSEGEDGPPKLERVLKALSTFDPQLGYVQGMNYLAASFLFHCEEHIAFWNVVALYEKLEFRDIYLPGFPGLSKHIQVFEFLLYSHLPFLSVHMVGSPFLF